MNDYLERRIATLERLVYPMPRQVEAIRTKLGTVDQKIQGMRAGGSFFEDVCTVPSNWCFTNPIPCVLRCDFTFSGGLFAFTSQTMDVTWEGAGSHEVWSGCAICNFTGSGGCVSGTSPVWVTLTLPDSGDAPTVRFRWKQTASCPVVATCADTPNGSFVLSDFTGATYTMVCSPFEFEIVQGSLFANFTPA